MAQICQKFDLNPNAPEKNHCKNGMVAGFSAVPDVLSVQVGSGGISGDGRGTLGQIKQKLDSGKPEHA